jgi:hypothetical protein
MEESPQAAMASRHQFFKCKVVAGLAANNEQSEVKAIRRIDHQWTQN